MKKLLLIIPLVFLVALFSSRAAQSAKDQGHGKTAQEIWALEEAYVANHRDAKYGEIEKTWHEQFLGCPDPLPRPANKEEVIIYTKTRNPGPAFWTFKIEPAGIRVMENLVLNLYTLHYSYMSGGVMKKKSTRIIHTWIKQGSAWKLLEGMSNNK